jgi:hypothetical protein
MLMEILQKTETKIYLEIGTAGGKAFYAVKSD